MCPHYPGCFSGETTEEAKDNIKEAIEVYLESLRHEASPFPKSRKER